MKVSLKNSLIFFSAALAALFTGCASTPKGLTPSQAVGANHSPAALYMITFSDNAKDVFSAISKELKCKYFVKVNVKAGVRTTKTAVKPVAETAVYIYNKKNELKKELHGVVSIPPVLRETITDKNQITEMFPELIERSIQLASENLNHKDKLFEIKALKENTLELVTDKEWPISYAKWE